MDTFTFKDVQNSLDTNCSDIAEERNSKYEITHPEQGNSKLPLKNSPAYALVKQSKENSLKLVNTKRKQKQKEGFEQGEIFIKYYQFYWCYCK